MTLTYQFDLNIPPLTFMQVARVYVLHTAKRISLYEHYATNNTE